MADFNKILEPGDYQNNKVNVVIEIPTGSNHKIEWDREHACFMLDRIEPIAFAKPCNYGFIPQTLDEDGDELDVLMITDQPLTTGIWMKARVLGVMKFVDDGEVDDKIICVPEDDRNNGDHYQMLEDLPERLIEQIEKGEAFYHFVEIMACPGGCVNGGGQPVQPGSVRDFVDLQSKRAQALYVEDRGKGLRRSHENPVLQRIYQEFLEKPGSHKAHHILHTSFQNPNLIEE